MVITVFPKFVDLYLKLPVPPLSLETPTFAWELQQVYE